MAMQALAVNDENLERVRAIEDLQSRHLDAPGCQTYGEYEPRLAPRLCPSLATRSAAAWRAGLSGQLHVGTVSRTATPRGVNRA